MKLHTLQASEMYLDVFGVCTVDILRIFDSLWIRNTWLCIARKHNTHQYTSIHINTPLELLANASSPSPFSCDFFTFPLGTFGRLNPVLFNEVSTQLPRDFVAVSTKAPTPLEDGRGYKQMCIYICLMLFEVGCYLQSQQNSVARTSQHLYDFLTPHFHRAAMPGGSSASFGPPKWLHAPLSSRVEKLGSVRSQRWSSERMVPRKIMGPFQ